MEPRSAIVTSVVGELEIRNIPTRAYDDFVYDDQGSTPVGNPDNDDSPL